MAQRTTLLEKTPLPLVVYGNHSSWWDPMLAVFLARHFLPHRQHYTPTSAATLRRYPILGKIGLFPTESHSAAGIAHFLRTSEAILKQGSVLWIRPQGRFADTREHPLRFTPLLALLAQRMPGLTLLPFATEFTYWDERLPEALVRFGDPVMIGDNHAPDAVTHELERALATTMLELQHASTLRDASQFHTLLTGTRGTGGAYGALQRLRLGQRSLDHTARR